MGLHVLAGIEAAREGSDAQKTARCLTEKIEKIARRLAVRRRVAVLISIARRRRDGTATRLPMVPRSVGKYLSTLPDGAASYPECCVKASVLRHSVAMKPLGPEVDLPAAVRRIVDDPPTVTEWIPEVHFNVIMLAIREVHFDPHTLDGFRAWAYEQNYNLLSTPLYRVLFFLTSPERLLNGLEKRWGAFRRGTGFQATKHAPGQIEVRLTYPAFLYSPLTPVSMALAFQVVIEHAGGKRVRAEAGSPSSTESVFELTWQ